MKGGRNLDEEMKEWVGAAFENVRAQARQVLREELGELLEKPTSPTSMRTLYFAFGRYLFQYVRANTGAVSRPPFNAEYVLYLLLRKEERDVVIGDLIEGYGELLERFNKRRADIWFYKQVGGSLFPLFRRALLRIGALVWLGRILRRLIS